MFDEKESPKRPLGKKEPGELQMDIPNVTEQKKINRLPIKITGKIKKYLKKFFPRRIKPTDQEKNKGPKV